MITERGFRASMLGQDPVQAVLAGPAGPRQLVLWRSVRKMISF